MWYVILEHEDMEIYDSYIEDVHSYLSEKVFFYDTITFIYLSLMWSIIRKLQLENRNSEGGADMENRFHVHFFSCSL